jgi:hypothetical protein
MAAKGWVLIGACLLVSAAFLHASAIYKCQAENGDIVYSDHPCGDPQASREIDDSTYSVAGRGGLTEREWSEYERLREERAARVKARIASGQAELETAIGYQDRLRLRELRMRRETIIDALDRGRVAGSERVALRRELKDIARREDAILNGSR